MKGYRPNVSSTQIHILKPNVMILGGGDFTKPLELESTVLMNGISALLGDSRELSCLSLHVRTQWEDAIHE